MNKQIATGRSPYEAFAVRLQHLKPFLVVLALLIPFFTGELVLGAESCAEKLDRWYKQYSSSDPFLAVQKTTHWDLSRSLLEQVVQDGGRSLKYEPVSRGKWFASGARVPDIYALDLRDYISNQAPYSARDGRIKSNLQRFFSRAVDAGTLMIADVGIFHAVDFYLNSPRAGVTFAHVPFNLETRFRTPEFAELVDALEMGQPYLNWTVDSQSSFRYSLPYFAAFQAMQAIGLSKLPDGTLQERDSDRRRILIGEQHDIRDTSLGDQLPDAACLKNKGINRIVFGVEGLPEGKQVSLADLKKKRNFLAQLEYRAAKVGLTEQEFIKRLQANRPKITDQLIKALYDGKVIDDPSLHALIVKLEQLQKQGISVEITGLEAQDYNDLGD